MGTADNKYASKVMQQIEKYYTENSREDSPTKKLAWQLGKPPKHQTNSQHALIPKQSFKVQHLLQYESPQNLALNRLQNREGTPGYEIPFNRSAKNKKTEEALCTEESVF